MNITMIGLGPMGQAMARAYLAAGHPVTVWNRTASRADELVAAGATRAATPAEAVAAGPLVLLSLTHYAAMYEILGDVGDALAGKVVVNLSSDTPQASRDAAAWLAERGAELLVGGIMVGADTVGTEDAYVFYSGPRSVFADHEPTLRVIGRPDYRGADPALAQLFYQALVHVFVTTLAAFVQGAALLGTAGVAAREYAPLADELVQLARSAFGMAATNIDADDHPDDGASAQMMAVGVDHIAGAVAAAGQDAALPDAVRSLYDRMIAAGYGKDSWTRMIDVIRPA
ncbi:NAD(P)-dependent oxidoreductase [Pseudonocardia sp. DSM 110487]|uniref:NAD(P)-dependent oxidoreductase n=1 Tax=Pseudonocardia sp. DSM 110487 TaxID=2865833 RepID=UPI002106B93C|nr:NAD(P)-binding domain-containing protein [Pseudonocardia sp. DSM 110487]